MQGGIFLIEEYIEKDILRQIKLVEFFFDLNKLNIKELAIYMNVSSKTIKNDLEKISILLNDYLDFFEFEGTFCKIKFNSKKTRYFLIKHIYQESKFLKVCSRYISGDYSYLKIVENEFISVSKAFQLKKRVEAFLEKLQLHENNELSYRYFILSVWMRCDQLDTTVSTKKWQQSKIFVDSLLHRFSNRLNEQEYTFFIKSVYLSIERHTNDKFFFSKNVTNINFIAESNTFKEIEKLVNIHLKELSGNIQEIIYLTSLYSLMPLNVSNYSSIRITHEYQRTRALQNFPSITKLIELFETKFNMHLRGNIYFEKSFFFFIASAFFGIQMFLVEKHYFLNKNQQVVLRKIKNILNFWEQNYLDTKFMVSSISLERFCVEIYPILVNEIKKTFTIMIVAENEFSHIFYRELLSYYLNENYAILDDTLYYSLDEIPNYYEQGIIICDRHLIKQKTKINKYQMYPISVNYSKKDIEKIIKKMYFV